MSGINGDKSRFNRRRKQRIALRQRNRERLQGVAKQSKLETAAAVNHAKERTA
jgi:hypothetical protein